MLFLMRSADDLGYIPEHHRRFCDCLNSSNNDIRLGESQNFPQNILLKFKDALERKNITLWVYTSGKDRISTIAKIPGITRKIKFDEIEQ